MHEEMEKYRAVIDVLKGRLNQTMPSMDINLYMSGLFQIAEDKEMEFVDVSESDIKFTCPKAMKGTEELKSLSGNLKNFVGLKLLVKYI